MQRKRNRSNPPSHHRWNSLNRFAQSLNALVNSGEVESISVYAQCRDGSYLNRQSVDISRHEDAGRILELVLLRLGFLQREHVEAILTERGA